ncbi:hypothetical protein JHK85_054367 [Glycine max]|nr:hypothetical protein JHK85_054367 [Glycine max]KAH1077763.1 hypothetical protein GYH30_053019 [Glycine max]
MYTRTIKKKVGLSPENEAQNLEALFESISRFRCLPGPIIDEDKALQMSVNVVCYITFLDIVYFSVLLDGFFYIPNFLYSAIMPTH